MSNPPLLESAYAVLISVIGMAFVAPLTDPHPQPLASYIAPSTGFSKNILWLYYPFPAPPPPLLQPIVTRDHLG